MRDELVTGVMIVIGVFTVLVMLLVMQSFYGGEWQTVSENVAPAFLGIVVFAVVVASIVMVKKR